MGMFKVDVQTVHWSTHTVSAETPDDAEQAAYEMHREIDSEIVDRSFGVEELVNG